MKNMYLLLVLVCSPLLACEQELPADDLPQKRIALLMSPQNPTLKKIKDGVQEGLKKAIGIKAWLHVFEADSIQEREDWIKSIIEPGEFHAAFAIGQVSMNALGDYALNNGSKLPIVGIGGPSRSLAQRYQERYPITWVTEERQYGKQLDKLLEKEPNIKSILLVHDCEGSPGNTSAVQDLRKACTEKFLDFEVVKFEGANKLGGRVTTRIKEAKPDIVMTFKDTAIMAVMKKLAYLCSQEKVKLYAANLTAVEDGADYAFGFPEEEFGKAAGSIMLDILEHGIAPCQIKPKDLSVLSKLVIKQKTEQTVQK